MPHVLVVEGDESKAGPLADAVKRRGWSSGIVGTLKEARAEFDRQPADLILAAPALPDGSVLDLLLHLSPEHEPRVAVLVGDSEAGPALVSLGSRFVTCIASPAEDPEPLDRLIEEVRRAAGADRSRRRDDGAGEEARFGPIRGRCGAMRDVYGMIDRVAPTDATVLVIGESGTGKELVARAIHEQSPRKDHSFIDVNCGAIPENLIESELFGHEQGAFTGAVKSRKGVFERAAGGTLFLDEITEMPLDLQVKLLRVLETGTLNRVGGEREIDADTRLIAATNRDPHGAVREGRLRMDLLYRLSVFPIQLPPLHQRGDDVTLLAHHFLTVLNREQRADKKLTPLGIQRLKNHPWPGNVRQLKNIIHRAFILEDDRIDLTCLQQSSPGKPARSVSDAQPTDDPAEADGGVATTNGDEVELPIGMSIADAEQRLIFRTLEEYDGDKKKTAAVLGVSLKTLYNRLKQYEQQREAQFSS